MELSKEDLADMLRNSEGNTLSEEEVSNAIEELENNTLEIEGYERVQWTKFDSCKEDTYPAKLTPILAFGFPNPDNSLMPEFFVCQLSVMCDFISKESYDAKVIFWRPLQKPPIETEETK